MFPYKQKQKLCLHLEAREHIRFFFLENLYLNYAHMLTPNCIFSNATSIFSALTMPPQEKEIIE